LVSGRSDVKFEFEGRTREIDIDGLGLRHGIAITEHMGMPLTKWEKALADTDGMNWLKAMRCLYWLMLAQAGDLTPLDDDIDFHVLKFSAAVGTALVEAAGGEVPEEDPTMPADAPGAAPPSVPGTGSTGSSAAT
jgi:hypothetical protein